MSIHIYRWIYRGETIFTAFISGYKKRLHRRSRRYLLEPGLNPHFLDLTAEEVGQLLGGN